MGSGYLALHQGVSLRMLEEPCLYDRVADELYELNQEAWDYLLTVDGLTADRQAAADPDFLAYLMDEGLVECLQAPTPRPPRVGEQAAPSLRYLELYLTERCNLRCGHCFLGELGRAHLPLPAALRLLDEFDDMGGLRLLLTGGEAVLHPDFWALNESLPTRGFRTVLLSNGTLLADIAERLSVQEVQVSLDGLEDAHDRLRGEGAFRRALDGLRAVSAAGRDVSVATTVNSLNRADFPALSRLVSDLGARAWHVDAPSECGTLARNPGLALAPEDAAPLLDYAYGGGVHDAVSGAVCGSHLMAVFADGSAAKCGFYHDEPVGSLDEGLGTLWRRLPREAAADLLCSCAFLESCHGGCRFRASLYNGIGYPDPVQCCRYGVPWTPQKGEV